MTANRDSDRIIRAWLDLMPDEAPDRVVAAVVERTERLPQLGGRSSRRASMPRILAALAATLVVAVVATLAVIRQQPTSPAATASEAPSALPTPGPSSLGVGVPGDLQGAWLGNPITAAGIPSSRQPSLQFSTSTVTLVGPNLPGSALRSSVTKAGLGTVALTTDSGSFGCPAGTVGTYAYSVAGAHRILTLTPNDPCVARAQALAGTWLASRPCPDGGTCFGDLVAGTWRSQVLDVLSGPDEIAFAHPTYGALTYSVPDGWSNTIDNTGRFALTLTSEAAKSPDDRLLGLYVFPRIEAASQDPGCPYAAFTPPVEQRADALAAWVAARPSIVATPIQPTTVGGHHAVWLDLRLRTKWTRGCEFLGGSPYAPLFFAQRGDFGLFGAGNLEDDRLVLVDIAPNRVVLIVIQSFDLTRSQAFFTDAMDVVQSFAFR